MKVNVRWHDGYIETFDEKQVIKAGRKRQEGQERSKAANELNSHALLPDCVTPLETNGKIVLYSRSHEEL